MQGFIVLHRKMLDWEWFTDINTSHLFMYCLLKANHENKKWRGINIDRGSFVTSLEHISKDTGLSIQNIRTSLNKLKSTNELTCKTTSQYSIISIKNYNLYQDYNTPINKQLTNEQQTTNKRLTTNNNDNNDNNDNNKEEEVKEEEKSKKACDFYGEFGNVYLSKDNFQKLQTYILNTAVLNELIEELSAKISKKSDRYKPYDEKFPNAHYLYLMDFWKFRQNNPQKFMTPVNNVADIKSIIDKAIEKGKMKNDFK